jgi:hypothetical protein
MFHKLVSHNNDLKHLVDKGYAVAFDSNYLIIRNIPYLDNQGQLHTGAIVTTIVFIDREHVNQHDHQIFFAGSHPHDINKMPIPNLGGGSASLALSEACGDVVVQRSFSHKPRSGGYKDFFEKIETYVAVISGPAMELHEETKPYSYRVQKEVVSESVFKFHDTLTSLAGITDLSAKFKDDVVVIIGLGGTGAYVLDYLVKTPVREIHAFDNDLYYVHNAFRSPGRTSEAEFRKLKTEVYSSRYDNYRTGISVHPKRIDVSCGDDLEGVTFAFVCVDNGPSRAGIFDLLLSKRIPFIDVGMDLRRKNGALKGMARVTYFSSEHGKKVLEKKLAELNESPENLYRSNIQIAELNALNACLAVIKFKQLRGFYFEEIPYFNLVFDPGDMKIFGLDED